MRNHDQFIEAGDVRLRVRVEGSGPAIVLLHGWALDLDMWQPQFAGLVQSCRLVAFDRRGFGLSSGEPDLSRDVEDVAALLDILAIRRAAIVGMSQGARVALRCAERFPQRVACVILDGPPPHGSTVQTQALEEIPLAQYREIVRTRGIESLREQWLRHPLMRLQSAGASARALLQEIVGRYPGRDLLNPAESVPEVDLSQVIAPTLVINGEYDSGARIAAGDELVRLLPDAQRAMVTAAGHLSNLDNPAQYNQLLLDFVSRPEMQSRPQARNHLAIGE